MCVVYIYISPLILKIKTYKSCIYIYIKNVYPCCCFLLFFSLLLLLLLYSTLSLSAYMYTLYRPIGTQTGKENRGSSAHFYYRYQTNSSVALSIGSARQEIIYESIPLANREILESRGNRETLLLGQVHARESLSSSISYLSPFSRQ